jgi:DNA-binding NtrC family response regulator
MADPSRAAPFAGSRILVVEDNHALRRGLCIALSDRGATVDEESNGEAAVARIADHGQPSHHVVVTDLRLPGADGLAVLRHALERDAETRVIMMTAYGSIDWAVEAMRCGAFDFIQKPFDLELLERRVASALEQRCAVADDDAEKGAAIRPATQMSEGVVAESAAMREAVDLARRVADTRSTVLITGETGTGKEIVAGMIHSFSARAHHSFVKVNCAALPETLLESELFGHERGAFTGADRMRIGRFEEASGGTLFLDEIGEVTPATQAKLLRVLQDQEFYRLGGTRALRTDARIVAATNRDLLEARRNGTFREDLYFRLDVIGIKLPPLRERPLDLMALAERLLTELSAEQGREFDRFSEEALACIRGHAWPGNVRELRNVIERAVLTASGKSIEASDLALGAGSALGANGRWRIEIPEEGIALQDVEREVVMATLERVGHVQKEAARLLGISRRKLNYKIQRMGLTHPSWRRNRAPAAHPSTAPPNAVCSDD